MTRLVCELCNMKMIYFTGEDEKSDGRLYPYNYWYCPTCNRTVWDYEDEFEYPEDLTKENAKEKKVEKSDET